MSDLEAPFNMFIRGRRCRVYGWVEPGESAAGITQSYFCIDEIQEYGHKGGGGRLYSADEIDALTGTELAEIERAFWAQAPAEPGDLTAAPERARIAGPASWVAQIGRWLGGLTGREKD